LDETRQSIDRSEDNASVDVTCFVGVEADLAEGRKTHQRRGGDGRLEQHCLREVNVCDRIR